MHAHVFALVAVLVTGCGGKEFTAADDAQATTGGDAEPGEFGCADGSREGFDDEANIAACAGGFQVPGITGDARPRCGRNAGNDGADPAGSECGVDDLCAEGWHVCSDASDVATSSSTGSCEPGADGSFWLTRQAQDQNGQCAGAGSNNLLGCGDGLGQQPPAGCEPLNTELRYTDCLTMDAWDCGSSDDANFEADVVVKVSEREGGVLCCRD
jgi:hypothetical protein